MTKISEIAVEAVTAADDDWFEMELDSDGTSRKIKKSNLLGSAFSGCKAKMNADMTTQDLTTPASIPFNGTDEFDTDSYHDPASNNTRVIAPTDGYYLIRGQVGIASATSGVEVTTFIQINGATPTLHAMQRAAVPSTTRMVLQVSETRFLSATQYATLLAGVSVDTSVTIEASRTWLEMIRLA